MYILVSFNSSTRYKRKSADSNSFQFLGRTRRGTWDGLKWFLYDGRHRMRREGGRSAGKQEIIPRRKTKETIKAGNVLTVQSFCFPPSGESGDQRSNSSEGNASSLFLHDRRSSSSSSSVYLGLHFLAKTAAWTDRRWARTLVSRSYGLLRGQKQRVDVFKPLELWLVYSLDDVPEEEKTETSEELLHHLTDLCPTNLNVHLDIQTDEDNQPSPANDSGHRTGFRM